MPKVFIPNLSGHDVSSAEQFGELVILSRGTQDRLALSHHFRRFSDYLGTSKADDFLMISGPASMVGIVSAIMASKHGKINYLMYSRGEYKERTVVYGSPVTQEETSNVE